MKFLVLTATATKLTTQYIFHSLQLPIKNIYTIQQNRAGSTRHGITVGVPNVFLGFGCLQIIQIIQTCHKLFTVEDVLKNVEIWRKTHAVAVLDAVAQVFGDITIEHEMSMLGEDQIDIEMAGKR